MGFYLEILKYQDLFHSHKCKDVVESKIKSMINTYIKCQVALQQGEKKELQIDIADQTKQRILTSCKDNNPAFLFQPTKNTLFRCLLRPYNQFKKDQEEEKSELKTEIL